MKYRIWVEMPPGQPSLVYKEVESYEVKDGFVVFVDRVTKRVKRYPAGRCEIEDEEVESDRED